MLFRSTKKFRNDVSLSDPVGVDKDGNELTLLDLLSEKEDSVFEAVETRVTAAHLAVVMKRVLTDREYQILSLRYGLKGGVPLAQREVAERLGISRSYISRIEARAVQKIRAAVEETP
jgi:RNA polymerase sporulation-specific sigma factor